MHFDSINLNCLSMLIRVLFITFTCILTVTFVLPVKVLSFSKSLNLSLFSQRTALIAKNIIIRPNKVFCRETIVTLFLYFIKLNSIPEDEQLIAITGLRLNRKFQRQCIFMLFKLFKLSMPNCYCSYSNT